MMQPGGKDIGAWSRRAHGQRGLALVTVLWVLMLLALIAASFTRTTRLEINLTRNLIENAKAEALADAGVYRAVYGLVAAERRIDFGADVEKVLQGRPALREALERRPEVQMAQPDYLEPREGWRTDGTVYAWDCDGAKVLIAIQ